LFSIIGIVWGFSIKGFCLGDAVLDFFRIKSWSNGDSGTHYTVFYSLLFYALALIFSYKYPNSKGAKVGMITSIIMCVLFIGILLFGIAV